MSISPEYFVAFGIGFFGSLHCVGMCGPISLALPTLNKGILGRLAGGLIYNFGRLVTYTFLGSVLGILGLGIAFFHWQQYFSLAAGIVILSSILIPRAIGSMKVGEWTSRISVPLQKGFGRFLKRKSAADLFMVGILNGLLPCGLVYLAIAGSIEMSTIRQAAFFMMAFALGTFPMMLGVHLMGYNLKEAYRKSFRRVIPAFTFFIGVLFILRGMGLGIPYLSPSFDSHTGDINCHLPEHRH